MSDDYISRQAVLDAMQNNYRDGGRDIDGDYVEGNYREHLYDDVMSIPPTTPQPKTGHWIKCIIRGSEEWGYKCSECNFCKYEKTINLSKFKFCPNCGAKMEVSE